MGAHPQAPSRLRDLGCSLLDWIAEDPERALGAAARRFSGRLPYLFKVLAAEQPLSLQAHPSKQQAERGFAREAAQGIASDAPERNYKDDNHKPELLCALTPFWALSGFRSVRELQTLLAAFGIEDELPLFSGEARSSAESGLREPFRRVFDLSPAQRRAAIDAVARGAQQVLERTAHAPTAEESQIYWAARWGLRIVELYPDDPGVLAALFLNIVQLAPGEAMFLPAGQLHAYLGGVGLEIMASSDNVLRGGLTSKRVDVAELLQVLSFDPSFPVITAGEVHTLAGGVEVEYAIDVPEFRLSRIDLDGRLQGGRGPEILLCLEGMLSVARGDTRLPLEKGQSVFCAAADVAFEVEGAGRMARARVPGL
jgi:mannose-6-phosphate isomerase